MHRNEKILIYLLRLAGGVVLFAWLAVFLPTEWMAAAHRSLGLGEFPVAPLTEYLTRSISILYGIHGGVLVLLSTDLRRYRRLVAYIGVTDIVFGVLMLGIDLKAGLPAYWAGGGGPPIALIGLAILWLLRSVPEE